MEPQPKRPLLARVFISPDEPRLRAGWRLLMHTSMLLIALFAMGALLYVVDALAGHRLQGLLTSPVFSFVATPLVVTLVTWIARRFLDRRTFVSLGFHFDRRTLPDLLFGFALGGLLMGLIYTFQWAVGWLHFEAWAWETVEPSRWVLPLLGGLAGYIGVGYTEELWSRGYHLQNLTDGLNLLWGLFLSSAVFGLMHLFNPGTTVISTVNIMLAGYFLAFGWVRTRRLWIPIGLHIGWNFFQGTVFGFAVSGTGGFHLIRQSVDGPVIMTGGAFGPEAGLLGLVAMALGAGLIWVYTRGRTSPGEQAISGPAVVNET